VYEKIQQKLRGYKWVERLRTTAVEKQVLKIYFVFALVKEKVVWLTQSHG